MKITIDTTEKTAVVHGDASFNEIEAILKAVDPERWAIYRLSCQNVSFSTLTGTTGSYLALKGSDMLTYTTSGFAQDLSCKQ